MSEHVAQFGETIPGERVRHRCSDDPTCGLTIRIKPSWLISLAGRRQGIPQADTDYQHGSHQYSLGTERRTYWHLFAPLREPLDGEVRN